MCVCVGLDLDSFFIDEWPNLLHMIIEISPQLNVHLEVMRCEATADSKKNCICFAPNYKIRKKRFNNFPLNFFLFVHLVFFAHIFGIYVFFHLFRSFCNKLSHH